jgi:hypothetical protein
MNGNEPVEVSDGTGHVRCKRPPKSNVKGARLSNSDRRVWSDQASFAASSSAVML